MKTIAKGLARGVGQAMLQDQYSHLTGTRQAQTGRAGAGDLLYTLMSHESLEASRQSREAHAQLLRMQEAERLKQQSEAYARATIAEMTKK